MYRIKEDKRIRTSAELIGNGLVKCLKTKSISDITISEIAHESGVSRATFYRLFDTPTDVLSYLCDSTAEKAIEIWNSGKFKGHDECIAFVLKFMLEHSDMIESVLKSGRQDMLFRAFRKLFEMIVPLPEDGFSKAEILYIRESLAGVLCSILFIWLHQGQKETPEELIQIFRRFSQVAMTH